MVDCDVFVFDFDEFGDECCDDWDYEFDFYVVEECDVLFEFGEFFGDFDEDVVVENDCWEYCDGCENWYWIGWYLEWFG